MCDAVGNPTEDWLRAQLADPSDEFFQQLVKHYARVVRSELLRSGIRDWQLEDLEQDVWVRVWHARRQFRGGQGEAGMAARSADRAFGAWLKTLCRTAVSLARRRQARNARCCSLEELSATPHHIRELRAPEPVAARDNFDANLDLTRLMIGLSQRRRAVVVARLIDGLSTGNAPEELDRSGCIRRVGCRGVSGRHHVCASGVRSTTGPSDTNRGAKIHPELAEPFEQWRSDRRSIGADQGD